MCDQKGETKKCTTALAQLSNVQAISILDLLFHLLAEAPRLGQ
jgi:hypothetical protein